MNILRILVVGGLGEQGRPIVETLLRKGHEVRVLMRRTIAPGWLRDGGAEQFSGDLGDREALRRACHGMDGLFFIIPITAWPPKSYRYLDNVLSAARQEEVHHIVYSSSGAVSDAVTGVAFIDARSKLVHRMMACGLPITVLAPSVFLDNLKAPFAYPDTRLSGRLTWQYIADAPVSWITLDDHARYVAAAFEHPELAGELLRIASSRCVTGKELAELVGSASRRRLRYHPQPLTRFMRRAAPFMGWVSALALAQVFHFHRKHGTDLICVPDAGQTARRLGIEVMPIESAVKHIFTDQPIVSSSAVDPIVVRKTEADPISYRGQLIELVADGSTTAGTLCFWLGTCPKGLGPPVHVHHREHEAFYILEGTLHAGIENRKFKLGPGDFIFLPAHRPHWFAPGGKSVRMIGMTVPLRDNESLSGGPWRGQADMFRTVGEPARCFALPPFPGEPKDIDKLVAVATELGIEVLEPNPFIRPRRPGVLNRLWDRFSDQP